MHCHLSSYYGYTAPNYVMPSFKLVRQKVIPLRVIAWTLVCFCALPGVAAEGDKLNKLLLSEDPRRLTRAGLNFQYGQGVDRNIKLAIQSLCTAAWLNHGPAQYELGWLYMNRRHGRGDDEQAAAWLWRATGHGNKHAERLLGYISVDLPDRSRCPLPDGSDYLLSLKSKPNPSVEEIKHWVERLAPVYGLSAKLVLEVIRAESNFNVRARSPKNAKGLMQLMPFTANRFGVRDVWDPVQNIRGGMAYLRWLLDHFNQDLRLTLAGYNAGENAVHTYGGIPPFRETQHYVRRITHNLDRVKVQLK